jgi:hypothetical protein
LRLQGQTFQIKKKKHPEFFGMLLLFASTYTLQSQRIDFDLKQRVGDSVIVNVDPKNLEHYRMKL